mgnify:CR=1 FL=1
MRTALPTFLLATGCALALTACDALVAYDPDKDEQAETAIDEKAPEVEVVEAPAAEEPAEPVVVASAATIDWEAARRDLAASGERETTFNIQSGGSAPPVPVLLPSGPVRTASAGGPQPQFRPVPDGYFAVYPGEDYNLIVNGTNEVTNVPGGSPGDGESEDMRYVETSTGAIVSFSRYGADYMVEFECLGSGEEGGSCITEDEALAVAEEIVISGTQ